MKKFFIIMTILWIGGVHMYGQSQYINHRSYSFVEQDTKDSSKFNLIGLIQLDEIKKYKITNQYKHFVDTFSIHKPLLQGLKENMHAKQLFIFGGIWWCGDTRDILGKLLYYTDRLSLADEQVQFVGIDRAKKGVSFLSQIFNVDKVPTIIVLQQGKEIGRIVEFGKTGDWEKELTQLIKDGK